jgi:hypothetical protein
MILWYFSAAATVMFLGALVIRKRWLQLATGFGIWLIIVVILLFDTGSVGRAVAARGPAPAMGSEDAFYFALRSM